jgi:hypothetical protein
LAPFCYSLFNDRSFQGAAFAHVFGCRILVISSAFLGFARDVTAFALKYPSRAQSLAAGLLLIVLGFSTLNI